ncbi:MAG: hypothetical protein Kow0069_26790 [Promethearchaeota archaeon]
MAQPPAPPKPPTGPPLPSPEQLKNFCLLHKGEVQEPAWECQECGARYCRACVERVQATPERRFCVRCKRPLLL